MPTCAPADTISERLRAFHCGWILDGSGGGPLRDMMMTVADGRIVAIWPAAAGYAGIVPVDWRAFTILPPLVDAHVHLFLSGREDPDLRQRQLGFGFHEAMQEMEARVRRHFRRGIVAVRDGGDHGALALALRDQGRHRLPAGFVLRASGRAWHQAGRYGRAFGRSPACGQSLAVAVAGDGETIDHVKIINSGVNRLIDFGAPAKPQFDAADLGAAVRSAHRRGLSVMVHANGRQPVADALAAGCDSIEHGFLMGESNLARMAEQGVVWVPTVGAMACCSRCFSAKTAEADGARRYLDHQLSQLGRARALGVTVALGTDAGSLGVRHGRGMLLEMELMGAAGYSTGEVVRSAAVNGAGLLRLNRRAILRPGAEADFILVPGPPENLPGSLERIEALYLGGRTTDQPTCCSKNGNEVQCYAAIKGGSDAESRRDVAVPDDQLRIHLQSGEGRSEG